MATGRLPDPNTAPVTAKGDLYTYSTVPAKLAVGNNGETLVADSSTSTGLRYSPAPSKGNPIINSAMQIWQRGTSFAVSTAVYTADRWYASRGGTAGMTVSRQTTSDTTNLPDIQYALRAQRNSGNTSTAQLTLNYSFESVDSIPYAGKTVTLSFYARKGANYSPSNQDIQVYIYTGTGTDQTYLGSGITGLAFPLQINAQPGTSWQRFSGTATLSSSMTEFGILITNTPVGTAGANDWFEVTGFQIDLGSTALPYRTYAATLAGELCAAQRYYWRTTGQVYTPSAIGMTQTTTTSTLYVTHPVPMRVAPTSIDFSNLEVTDLYDYGKAISSLVIESGSNGTNTSRLGATHATGATQYRPAFIRNANNSAGYIGFSAEL